MRPGPPGPAPADQGAGETLAWFAFEALSGRRVHDLLRLRQDIFVVEQACAFADIDGRDLEAEHLLAMSSGTLLGALRLLASERDLRIGRVVVAPKARGTGLGHRLMRCALDRCRVRGGSAGDVAGPAIVLSAQAHLVNFYAAHGFIASSPTYLEDGIPHVDMRRAPR